MNTAPEHEKHDTSARGISRDQILDVALKIIDEEGLRALSMRKIATQLGVYPTTLYWHTGNRGQLLGLVSERVLSAIELPPADLPWQDWLFIFGVRARAVIGSHPRFAAYFVTNVQVTASSLTIAEAALAQLAKAGLRGNDLIRNYNAVVGAIFGWISGEFANSAHDSAPGIRAALESFVLDQDTYPTVKTAWPLAANRAYMLRWDSGTTSPLESSYEHMLTALLRGIGQESALLQASEATLPSVNGTEGEL